MRHGGHSCTIMMSLVIIIVGYKRDTGFDQDGCSAQRKKEGKNSVFNLTHTNEDVPAR